MPKTRDKKVKIEKLEKDYLSKFPSIYFVDKDLAPQSFEKEIKKAYRKLLFGFQTNKKNLKEMFFIEFMKKIKKLNIDTVLGDNMKEIIDWVSGNEMFLKAFDIQHAPEMKNRKLALFLHAAGKLRSFFIKMICDQINLSKYLPDYFASFGLYRNGFFIRFHQVQKEKTEGGTIYRHHKNLTVDGESYELWFSKHAIDRVLERVGEEIESPIIILGEFISHAPFSFNGFGTMQHLLCCYMPSPFRKNSEVYEAAGINLSVLDGHTKSENLMKYLYFPFVVKGNKIICKSALLPGFYGTPEYQMKEELLRGLPESERSMDIYSDELEDALKACMNSEDALRLCLKKFYDRNNENQNVISSEFCYISLMFHKHGMPQYFWGDFDGYQPIITCTKQLKQN